MASTVTGVEKEFVLETARDLKTPLRVHKAGWSGDARLATAQAGGAIVAHAAARLATLLDEVAAYPLEALREGPSARA